MAGRSGRGAIDDSARLCAFVYRNLERISEIVATLDTHGPFQIFHPVFWVDARGEHPPPNTVVSAEDVEHGRWRVNPRLARFVAPAGFDLDAYARHYARALASGGKYPLFLWPYHAMLGGVGHALVSAVEEAFFFHSIARTSPTRFEIKGRHPLTENYSVLRPEVLTDQRGPADRRGEPRARRVPPRLRRAPGGRPGPEPLRDLVGRRFFHRDPRSRPALSPGASTCSRTAPPRSWCRESWTSRSRRNRPSGASRRRACTACAPRIPWRAGRTFRRSSKVPTDRARDQPRATSSMKKWVDVTFLPVLDPSSLRSYLRCRGPARNSQTRMAQGSDHRRESREK